MLEVRVTTERVLVDGVPAARLPAKQLRPQVGFGAEVKPSVNSLLVLPLQEAASRALQERVSAVVYVDRDTEYRILVEVLYTLSKSGVQRFAFPVQGTGAGPVGWVSHNSPPPSPGAAVVLLVTDGLAVKYGGRSLAPGCSDFGPGVTVPHRNGQLDQAALRQCLLDASSRYANAAIAAGRDPDGGSIAGNAGIAFSDVMAVVEVFHQAGIGSFSFKVHN